MKTILTTGGLGFIGSHTSLELLMQGYDVCVVDSLENSSLEALENIKEILKVSGNKSNGNLTFKKGNIKNLKWLDNLFNEFKKNKKEITAVIHFAGFKSVEESVKEPIRYWENNLNSTINILDVMKKYQCHNFVFSSSATIYRTSQNKKINENFPTKPFNPYGNSKLAIETLLNDLYLSDSQKWRIVNLRYFNPAGAHTSGLLGEKPVLKPTNLFPIMMNVANRDITELEIFGKDWPTPDGTCIRDYIHIMDLAEAHLSALKFLLKEEPQIIAINIGTGNGTSVLEAVNCFSEVNNIHLPYRFEQKRAGDLPYVVADNCLALKLLDWKPKRDLKDMCLDSWKWIRNKSINL